MNRRIPGDGLGEGPLGEEARQGLLAALARDPWSVPPDARWRADRTHVAGAQGLGEAVLVQASAEASELDPLNADALVTLALHARGSGAEQLRWAQEIVFRARRSLGEAALLEVAAAAARNRLVLLAQTPQQARQAEAEGPAPRMTNLWSHLEVRGLLRALHHQARVERLWGSLSAARARLEELRLLAPGTSISDRPLLWTVLLEQGDLEAAERLLARSVVTGAWEELLRVVLDRLRGRAADADAGLVAAVRANLHLPAALAWSGTLPPVACWSQGSLEEALLAAAELRPLLARHPDLTRWMVGLGAQVREAAVFRLDRLVASLGEGPGDAVQSPSGLLKGAGFPGQVSQALRHGHDLAVRLYPSAPEMVATPQGYGYPAWFVRDLLGSLVREVRRVRRHGGAFPAVGVSTLS